MEAELLSPVRLKHMEVRYRLDAPLRVLPHLCDSLNPMREYTVSQSHSQRVSDGIFIARFGSKAVRMALEVLRDAERHVVDCDLVLFLFGVYYNPGNTRDVADIITGIEAFSQRPARAVMTVEAFSIAMNKNRTGGRKIADHHWGAAFDANYQVPGVKPPIVNVREVSHDLWVLASEEKAALIRV